MGRMLGRRSPGGWWDEVRAAKARGKTFIVIDYPKVAGVPPRVVLETDDWVDALDLADTRHWPRDVQRRSVEGTHPTHDWGPPHPGQNPPHDRRCRKCNGWDNGSYGSQSPCGYDWSKDALVSAIWRELAARKSS